MSDAWEEIQAIKSKRNSLREKLQKRKKERQDILNLSSGSEGTKIEAPALPSIPKASEEDDEAQENAKPDSEVECALLEVLSEVSPNLPVSSANVGSLVTKKLMKNVSHEIVLNLLQKFVAQQLISVQEAVHAGQKTLDIISAEHVKLQAMIHEVKRDNISTNVDRELKRKSCEIEFVDENTSKIPKVAEKEEKKREKKTTDIMSLLSMPSIREKETKKVGEEILDLLSKPTAKERSLAERFRSNGAQVMEFCPHGTRAECSRENRGTACGKLHFKKIIQKHTDESLGDCSFLNTCFHMDSCKYVHYEVDGTAVPAIKSKSLTEERKILSDKTILYPPQWIQCDLRYLDMTVLGKFAVIMADPPWDIHMELPYGTMSDDEMRQLGVPALQDDGIIFLWVTGRAMELGRECLQLWGYERVDELIWVKTNQLQRIIRTGRTGHWLNHGKEHCLVGKKGNISDLNRGLDCDVIVAEVRATSHKPDEIYGIIERLSPGTRKIELFGRPHNVQPNWITLGNQVDGVRLVDPQLIASFTERYPQADAVLTRPPPQPPN
ncbi:N6-adenosine-methyltransferase MT-A70-like protein isoform X1 [Halyomorpha halys]|uniref:N6-adenosine-methyltransferase MT-A70-like protein isoform X1 n=3 Tax=Halyomorpha halys TaxID=286706 RepID=UPI0006D50129|nr:N6-adenosine-methyltransferase subunit METTL3 isoform X1 [Halyomorpha halys]